MTAALMRNIQHIISTSPGAPSAGCPCPAKRTGCAKRIAEVQRSAPAAFGPALPTVENQVHAKSTFAILPLLQVLSLLLGFKP